MGTKVSTSNNTSYKRGQIPDEFKQISDDEFLDKLEKENSLLSMILDDFQTEYNKIVAYDKLL